MCDKGLYVRMAVGWCLLKVALSKDDCGEVCDKGLYVRMAVGWCLLSSSI